MAKAKEAAKRKSGYDQQAVIDGFLKHGKSIKDLAAAQKMSLVYCHRILTTKAGREFRN